MVLASVRSSEEVQDYISSQLFFIMDNNDDEDAYDVVEELPMETIISKENICYNQVLASVCADSNQLHQQ